jgi:hypothetical protein
MIDSLLSEPNLPPHLKTHKDGKEIDHIYPYQDLLTTQDQIYHIGDSKYYKDDSQTGKNAIAKQYTYAKNVIQYNVDVLNENKPLTNRIRYRDELTEGYNITPNFFISAVMNNTLDFQKDSLEFKENFNQNKHFSNRLFDRDTLILQTYNINFLYVIHAYVANNHAKKDKFKHSTRHIFRKKIVQFLDERYNFYEVKPNGDLTEFIAQNFRNLAGKMYRPSGWEDKILLAYEKENDNQKLQIKDVELVIYKLRD